MGKWDYKGNKTAFNGISHFVVFKGIKMPSEINAYVQRVGEIVREFLIKKELPVKLKKSHYDIDKNCKEVQKHFKDFRIYIEENQKII